MRTEDPFALTQGAARAVYARRPEVSAALDTVRAAMRDSGTLPPRLVELVRLRVAFHNQCRSCMALRYQPDLVDEDLVCSLERPAELPGLTDAERAALDYADRFATNHLSIDDGVRERLRAYFDEGEIVELSMRCAMFVGFGRMAATLQLVEHLPESFREPGPVTPWGRESVLTG
jgi:alkylhydroperoxidase family enzyme